MTNLGFSSFQEQVNMWKPKQQSSNTSFQLSLRGGSMWI